MAIMITQYIRSYFVNDYPLLPLSHLLCDICGEPATTAQNNDEPPFRFVCDKHAQIGRRTGKYYLD